MAHRRDRAHTVRTDEHPTQGRNKNMSRDATDAAPDVLVIRIWNEPDASPSFRARLLFGGEDAPGALSQSAADPQAVVAAVQAWLAAHGGRQT